MGCGRSTLGSDSPRRNSKNTDEDEVDAEERDSELHRSPPTAAGSAHGAQLSFSSGGQLLAQSKLSDSQVEFFKMLEERIDNGPDYDSEEEGALFRTRLQSGLRQWNGLFQGRNDSKGGRIHSTDSQALLKTPTDSLTPCTPRGRKTRTITRQTAKEANHTETLAGGEDVKEQYMFMGNVYTLTRSKADGSQVPHVDVSPAPIAAMPDDSIGFSKVNGAYASKPSVPKSKRLQRSDTPVVHNSTYSGKVNQARPASLVLRTVFQSKDGETSTS